MDLSIMEAGCIPQEDGAHEAEEYAITALLGSEANERIPWSNTLQDLQPWTRRG